MEREMTAAGTSAPHERMTMSDDASKAVGAKLERKISPSARSCKSCRFLRVHPDARGRITVRADRVYECLVQVPQPALPDSMTRAFGYRWPPAKSYMRGDDGRECPTWEKKA